MQSKSVKSPYIYYYVIITHIAAKVKMIHQVLKNLDTSKQRQTERQTD